MIWQDDKKFTINGQMFLCDTRGPKERLPSTVNQFTIVKNKPFFKAYSDINSEYSVNSILELGIFQGGSAAFFMQYYEPEVFAAVEMSKNRIVALDEFVEKNGLQDTTELCYGMDQSDESALEDLVKNKFPMGIDLIVDDASHDYELSRKSFEILFSSVSPGGYYLVEDWSWAHSVASGKGVHPRQDLPALTNLLFEMIMILGSDSKEISSIVVHPNMFVIKKGHRAKVSQDKYDIASHYRQRSNWPVKLI